MKQIAVECMLVFFALSQLSCSNVETAGKNSKQEEKAKMAAAAVPPTDGDSSPIIVADGSIRINQKYNFRVHNGTSTSIKLAGFRVSKLGYKCNPDQTDSTAGDFCNVDCSPEVAHCGVDLTDKEWTLHLFDDAEAVTMTCSKTDNYKKIGVNFTKGFSVLDGPQNGKMPTVDLVAIKTGGSGKLQKAKLDVKIDDSTTKHYTFKCDNAVPPTRVMCVTIGYGCPDGKPCDSDAGPATTPVRDALH